MNTDWDTLWKDGELREDFAAAVRMNEEWIKQTEWLKASAPIGRSIQRHNINEHFETHEDVMTRWAKHFAPRNKQVRKNKQIWYSEECIEAKKNGGIYTKEIVRRNVRTQA